MSTVPQANNLGVVASVVDSIAEGRMTSAEIAEAIGYVGRQGSYYLEAAEHLGLVFGIAGTSPREYELTPVGETFEKLDSDQRSEALISAIADDPLVQVLVCQGEEELLRVLLTEGLNIATARRRAASFNSWLRSVPKTLAREIEKRRAASSSSARVVRARRPVSLHSRRCASCSLVMAPAEDECSLCGGVAA